MVSLERQGLLEESESMENEVEHFSNNLKNNQHCHSLLLERKEDKTAERVLFLVTCISALFIITEFTGGILSNSLSIISDAGHMLSDFFSFVISLVMIRISKLPANKHATFGYGRAEVLGALISVLIIWILTILLILFATQRIISGDLNVNPDMMLITAAFGVTFNIIMALSMMCCSRKKNLTLGHNHSHLCRSTDSDSDNQGLTIENVNIRAAFIHILGDFVQSLGVLCSAIIIKFTGWTLADPICTYLFSVIVLCTSLPVFRDICLILLESAPRNTEYSKVYHDIVYFDSSIAQVHSLHIWTLNSHDLCASVHIVINNKLKTELVILGVTQLLQTKHKIIHSTIQIETKLKNNCVFCEPLP